MDGRTVGDVLTHASTLLENGTDSDDWVAWDVAGTVNHQSLVAAGVVPEGGILYRFDIAPPAATGVAEGFWMEAPAPNPATSRVVVRYALDRGADAAITVHDLLGREVIRMAAERKPMGRSSAVIDVSSLSPGVYLISITDRGRRRSATLVVQ